MTLPEPARPSLTFVFRVTADVGAALTMGKADGILKRIFPITGGTVRGAKLSGTLLPGADSQSVMPDGTAHLCARYVIKAEDGALIAVTNSGIRRGAQDVLDRIIAGETVDPALYYFRTTPVFDVADGPHRWLRDSMFVCSAARTSSQVILDFFQVE